MKSHHYSVYILECSDGSYYTGVTNNIIYRLFQHITGYHKKAYTYTRRPVKLKYCEHFTYIISAIFREKQIKGWTRAKKKALIDGDIERLIELSKPRKKNKG